MGKIDDLAEEVHGNMAGLTERVSEMKDGWDHLKAANVVVTERLDTMEQSLSALSLNMAQISETLARMEANGNQPSDSVHKNNVTQSSASVRDGFKTPPKERGENRSLGYRGVGSVLENRGAVLKKIELPPLDGSSPYSWISLAERFFNLGKYTDEERLDLLSITLQGPALHWFNREMLRDPFRDWPQFKKRMIARFSQKLEENPRLRLFGLKQTGSIADYVNEFEELITIVPGIEEENLEQVFYLGLKPEMQEVVKMQKPRGLTAHFNAVISMEGSVFCSSVAETLNHTKRSSHDTPLCSSSSSNSNKTWGTNTQSEGGKVIAKSLEPLDKNETQHQDAKPPWKNDAGKNYSGMMKLSPAERAERAERRRLGLCYKCPEKWSRTHDIDCQNKQLQAFTVIDNEVVEIIDDEWAEGFEEASDIVPELRELSLLSYLGVASPAATTLWGEIGKTKVIVMIDSGASHNFIDPSVLERTRLAPSKNRKLEILLGTGSLVNGSGICQDVSLVLQSHEFTADFIVLELGNADIILGVQWLRTLGKCGYDWDKHEMSFMYNGEMITLFGDPELLDGRGNLKALQTLSGTEHMGSDMELFEMNQTEVIQVIPEQRQQVLDPFVGVFAEPQQSGTAQLMSYTVPENSQLQVIEQDVQLQEHVTKILDGKKEREEFQGVTGREAPVLLHNEQGSTSTFDLEIMLTERDLVLQGIKDNLVQAQARMNNNAVEHRRDLEFVAGAKVFLKSRPSRQQSVSNRLYQKLAARFYGPFEVLEKVGEVAYRLKLPDGSKIHPVFHVSQLKPVLGSGHQVSTLPDSFSVRPELIIEPEAVLDMRYNDSGHLEGLIKWKGLPDHEKTWVRTSDLLHQFPELEDKLLVDEGGIVRVKNREQEEVAELDSLDELDE
uniref:Chromo domain-containing protein n=1 Tax=Noccaea caerulescens TaxID=107243 RepID=A0A1J3JLS9_NOCCA